MNDLDDAKAQRKRDLERQDILDKLKLRYTAGFERRYLVQTFNENGTSRSTSRFMWIDRSATKNYNFIQLKPPQTEIVKSLLGDGLIAPGIPYKENKPWFGGGLLRRIHTIDDIHWGMQGNEIVILDIKWPSTDSDTVYIASEDDHLTTAVKKVRELLAKQEIKLEEPAFRVGLSDVPVQTILFDQRHIATRKKQRHPLTRVEPAL